MSADGVLSIQDNTGLLDAGADDSFTVTVSKTGFDDIMINVSVTVLDADTCVFVDPSAGVDGIGSRVSPRNTMPSSFNDNTAYLFRRGTVLTGSASWSVTGLSNVLFASYGTGAMPELRNLNTAFRIGGGSDHITVRDLHLSYATLDEWGVVDICPIYGSAGQWSNISIVHNELSHWYQGVVIISWDGQPRGQNITVEWNHVHHIGLDGIFVSHADGLTSLSNNRVEQVNTRWDSVGHTEQEAG